MLRIFMNFDIVTSIIVALATVSLATIITETIICVKHIKIPASFDAGTVLRLADKNIKNKCNECKCKEHKEGDCVSSRSLENLV